jgi:hypothetical protein
LALTDSKLEVLQRTKELNNEDFLEILKNNCKNFSFSNTQLWRSKYRKYDLELFTQLRKKSLIVGTDKEICKFLVGADMYLIIPFDDSEIVFCTICDLLD